MGYRSRDLESPLNYARIYLPDMLPRCVRRCIYLDTDMVRPRRRGWWLGQHVPCGSLPDAIALDFLAIQCVWEACLVLPHAHCANHTRSPARGVLSVSEWPGRAFVVAGCGADRVGPHRAVVGDGSGGFRHLVARVLRVQVVPLLHRLLLAQPHVVAAIQPDAQRMLLQPRRHALRHGPSPVFSVCLAEGNQRTVGVGVSHSSARSG